MSGKIVATNKKAYHEYQIDSILEAGMVLLGSEVKSLRAGRANLRDGYVKIKNGEAWLLNVHISPYTFATYDAPDPMRERKLLLSAREIKKLVGKVQEKGFALIPIKIYFNSKGLAKLGLGLCKGKTLYDKRNSLKKKEADREMDRLRKNYK
ncbi:MAG: SsrA-binding protein SmpB [Proteobacteria bacterium]|nr:SsrA-binding protein SmpB [Pseudomonadota bacterium]MBU4297146.1 SsrA-binding protein SmpB [Pseudomonadota bacterium]MCG2746190.1 SsrA-binding protein SmpB [Desulfobulbaceae bacterium]